MAKKQIKLTAEVASWGASAQGKKLVLGAAKLQAGDSTKLLDLAAASKKKKERLTVTITSEQGTFEDLKE